MLAQQRQAVIAERVRSHGAVRVAELVEEFGVSDMTIRRDLETLADRGLVSKVHGGATAVDIGSTDEPGFAAKSVRQKEAKEAIAAAAAKLVTPGQAIALSGGTTTWTLAHHLVGVAGLTVVTNSVPVADVFYRSGRGDQTVILTGGIRTPSDALVGPFAVASLKSINVDTLFLGVHGVNATAGFTTPNLMESETDKALIAAARKLVVVADSTKWEIVGIRTIACPDDADVLVTDAGLPEEARAALREAVGQLIIAGEDNR
ncbi:DeoR/GlpR family DNA-binding transcription regulator [Stackebrandtia nassauensis]|uniref:Transcriptional regulator, DeoR family n=1 Tax=Stackebrandtia nassauensis (strain DSM 44728 / CIP 108903 / NRRL B-16338 / NBRC 102104 / LLR-40K-21) TaxID=446470 RepID=D3Q8Z7_STANL|nr:DeoR/GlpR family DNA-binding transcription regulator [Stackebrandtia nassauensis]ADD40606.1 transcriptional regulator, DeoR family [Stackebrandtia nassauensis DSM 44728]